MMADTRLILALFQPDIPQNAGTMLRSAACLGASAAIVEPAAFPTSDRHFRRAGMDYLDALAIERHVSWRAFEAWRAQARRRLVLLTTAGETSLWDFAFRPGDVLVAKQMNNDFATMLVKAIGVVTEPATDGHRVGVDWVRDFRSAPVTLPSSYRQTLTRVSDTPASRTLIKDHILPLMC